MNNKLKKLTEKYDSIEENLRLKKIADFKSFFKEDIEKAIIKEFKDNDWIATKIIDVKYKFASTFPNNLLQINLTFDFSDALVRDYDIVRITYYHSIKTVKVWNADEFNAKAGIVLSSIAKKFEKEIIKLFTPDNSKKIRYYELCSQHYKVIDGWVYIPTLGGYEIMDESHNPPIKNGTIKNKTDLALFTLNSSCLFGNSRKIAENKLAKLSQK